MYEVRIHGRGGQGVVTAAELLSAVRETLQPENASLWLRKPEEVDWISPAIAGLRDAWKACNRSVFRCRLKNIHRKS